MANASMVLLDETLNYLNGKEIDNIAIMGAMMEQEAAQFLSFTESTDIVLNEKFSAKELKEKAIKAIKAVIDKIKDFIKWIKDKVVGFFKAVRNKLKSRKSLKQLLSEVKSKVTHESVSFVNEDAASNKDKLDEFLGRHIRIHVFWSPDRFVKISQQVWRLYSGKEHGTKGFLYYDGLNDIMKTEMNIGASEFVPSSDGGAITVKSFIEQDWEGKLEGLCNYLDGTNKDMIDQAQSKLKVFEKKLSEINGYSDEDILNAGSLKDLIDVQNSNNDKKSEYEEVIRETNKFITIMVELTNWANKYVIRCKNAVEENKNFLENMKKEILSSGQNEE